ncbi:MAG TPA: hypothetical protein VLR45_09205 [Desulfoprunum sp.]|nr:hypothetical protein [Desulfoprunum sp.]
MRCLILVAAVVSLVLAGCEASFQLTTAGLSEPAISTAVDLNTKAPLEVATIFPADTKTLYATVKVKNAPADTAVKAVFYYLEGSRQQIAEDTVKAQGGSRYLGYAFNPPESGWPVGRYEVEFVLNGEVKEKAGFSIVPAADMPATKGFPTASGQQSPSDQAGPPVSPPQSESAPPAAQPEAEAPAAPPSVSAASQQGGQAPAPSEPRQAYKTFQDKQFGFSFELPETWTFQTVGVNSDYLFSGQPGTPESEISVIVQVVDTNKGVVGNLKDQMLALLNQLSQMPGAKIESKSQIQAAGQAAPFFLVTYPAEDSKKQQVTFGHTQLGIDHPPYLLLISYSAPRQIYQQNVTIFQHMVDSLKLMAPVR